MPLLSYLPSLEAYYRYAVPRSNVTWGVACQLCEEKGQWKDSRTPTTAVHHTHFASMEKMHAILYPWDLAGGSLANTRDYRAPKRPGRDITLRFQRTQCQSSCREHSGSGRSFDKQTSAQNVADARGWPGSAVGEALGSHPCHAPRPPLTHPTARDGRHTTVTQTECMKLPLSSPPHRQLDPNPDTGEGSSTTFHSISNVVMDGWKPPPRSVPSVRALILGPWSCSSWEGRKTMS